MNITTDIRNHLETAAHESAHELYFEFIKVGSIYDKKAENRFIEMGRKGIRDIPGAYADEIFENPSFIEDMVGDKIYELAPTKEQRLKILDQLDEMKKINNGWDIALQKLKEFESK